MVVRQSIATNFLTSPLIRARNLYILFLFVSSIKLQIRCLANLKVILSLANSDPNLPLITPSLPLTPLITFNFSISPYVHSLHHFSVRTIEHAVSCRTLVKLSSKLLRASKERSGTVSNAWYFVANDFEQTAEIHKNMSTAITEEIGKPLKVS